MCRSTGFLSSSASLASSLAGGWVGEPGVREAEAEALALPARASVWQVTEKGRFPEGALSAAGIP